ncbi:MAG: hypothetical protein PQ612_08445 [Rickettsiales bacterium]|nr:hypothetical protein [Pseudomonadota bacterium]MDA0966749.1 hypothetical protein [Pseudomonadota bacterium]MDG4543421.1 hypothetical protein [Rickettsiales bacterium]MDG4546185.1 hypothetical protein [Rickettsiales bacterium]MDG4547658.1 hypothetical protein [Rickettsiales bacterium]
MSRILIVLFFSVLVSFNAIAQQDYRSDINDFVVNEMKLWLKNDIVIKALKKQNEKNELLSQTDKKILNDTWMGERRKNKRPLTDRVLENDLSNFLKIKQKESQGLFTEIIIIDAYGINAGQSMISDDYWQGNNEKWTKTLGSRSYGTYISDLAFDYNTEFFQVEVAFIATLNDEPIGVVYAGIDVEQLESWKKRLLE